MGQNLAKKRIANRRWYERNREAIKKKNSDHWHNVQKFQKDRNTEQRRKRRYGITNAEWDAIAKQQDELCALCRIKPPVDVDHCHTTGKIRGLLCRGCNVGLGLFGDSVDGLTKAIAYLKGS